MVATADKVAGERFNDFSKYAGFDPFAESSKAG